MSSGRPLDFYPCSSVFIHAIYLKLLRTTVRGAHPPRVQFSAPSRKTRSQRNLSSVCVHPARTTTVPPKHFYPCSSVSIRG